MASDEEQGLIPSKQKGRGSTKARRWLVDIGLVAIAAIVVIAILTPTVFLKKSNAKASSASYRHAAVAADAGLCSEAGVRILRLNGSAVDAAIAAMLCTGVVNSHSSGLGGGAFIVVYSAEKKTGEMIDAREVAPRHAYKDMYVGREQLARQGGLAVGVPGEVAGMRHAWEKYGRLEWAQLFQPAIELAEEGFYIHAKLAQAISGSREAIMNDPGLRELFTRDNGSSLLGEGDLLKRPQLADTFRLLAADPDIFYQGNMTAQMVEDINRNGGNITEEDFRQYRPIVRQLMSSRFDNLTVLAPPPPASGAVIQLLLGIIDKYDKSSWDVSSTLSYQRIVEAMKYSYGQRMTLGDPAFDPIVNQTLLNMTNPDTVQRMFQQISDDHTYEPEHYINWWSEPGNPGTAHISVLAENGDAVAVTTTINTYFGCKVRSPTLGLIYNNEMDDFSSPNSTNAYGLVPSPTNYISPGQRPMSSMSPLVLLDDDRRVRMVIGGAGGSRIISAVALSIINNRLFGDSMGPATERARLHHQLIPNNITMEETPFFPESIAQGLEEIGHYIIRQDVRSVVQGITVNPADDGVTIDAACDTRKGGYPDGY